MPRYIIIDNVSGYIFADTADIEANYWKTHPSELTSKDAPLLVCHWLDCGVGGQYGRSYEYVSKLADNESGYLVYRADINGSEAVAVVQDGHDADTIAAVMEHCELVARVRCSVED